MCKIFSRKFQLLNCPTCEQPNISTITLINDVLFIGGIKIYRYFSVTLTMFFLSIEDYNIHLYQKIIYICIHSNRLFLHIFNISELNVETLGNIDYHVHFQFKWFHFVDYLRTGHINQEFEHLTFYPLLTTRLGLCSWTSWSF